MPTIDRLVTADKTTRLGNHIAVFTGTEIHYLYHETCICKVDTVNRTFITDNGGWNTTSTTRAINCYKKYYSGIGYTDITKN